jgi:hypothetical protein
MRLLEMLSLLDETALEELRQEHLTNAEGAREDICLDLERELRSPSHVRATIVNLQPPGFCILNQILESADYSVPFTSLKERVMEESMMIAARVSSGDLASGDRDRGIYRRVLVEAQRSDLELDPSEVKLLAILRVELGIRTVEHFLMQHHDDFHAFWRTEHAFLDAMRSMRDRGLAFVSDGQLRLPVDLVPSVRQVLGLEGTNASRRRLFEKLGNEDLKRGLEGAGLKLGGAKDERLQRLLDHYIQPREVLELMALGDLRELCRQANITQGGAKDALVERVAQHFAAGWDVRTPEPAPPPPPPEPRVLAPADFDALFGSLRGEDLSDILTGIEASRVSGSKESKVAILRNSLFSEASLLMHLDTKQLENALSRRHLKVAGAKRDRVARLLSSWAGEPSSAISDG